MARDFVLGFLVTTWYRPPDSKVEIFDKFESYLLKLDQEDKESIIMGDTIVTSCRKRLTTRWNT